MIIIIIIIIETCSMKYLHKIVREIIYVFNVLKIIIIIIIPLI